MNNIREHQQVVLTTDLPNERLTAGDVGTVVHIYNDGKAIEVEFCALTGETIAVVTLEGDQIRGADHLDLAHARRVA